MTRISIHFVFVVITLIVVIGSIHGRPVTTTQEPVDDSSETLTEEDLQELEQYVSPKLYVFLQRLAKIQPQLLETGEIKLQTVKLMGKDEMDEIIQAGDPAELKQFKADLGLVSKLLAKYPSATKLIQLGIEEVDDQPGRGTTSTQATTSTTTSTAGSTPQRGTTSSTFLEEIDPFFNEFTKVDKELSAYPEWNRYWTYWFRRYGDYMAKYG